MTVKVHYFYWLHIKIHLYLDRYNCIHLSWEILYCPYPKLMISPFFQYILNQKSHSYYVIKWWDLVWGIVTLPTNDRSHLLLCPKRLQVRSNTQSSTYLQSNTQNSILIHWVLGRLEWEISNVQIKTRSKLLCIV